jgi:ferritin-like protein
MVERMLVGGGALVAAGVLVSGLASESLSAPSPKQDARILNFALHLEYLQARFYAEAVERGALTGELLQFAQVAGRHERVHVRYLRRVLGEAAQPPPTFDFGAVTGDRDRFGRAAVTLEDLAVAAYNGQGTNLTRGALGAAVKIVSVEARHAAWVRAIVGQRPAPHAQDPLWSAVKATNAVERTGFVGA